MFYFWNQSSNGNVIHKGDVKFPNFSQNAATFPNSIYTRYIKTYTNAHKTDNLNLNNKTVK